MMLSLLHQSLPSDTYPSRKLFLFNEHFSFSSLIKQRKQRTDKNINCAPMNVREFRTGSIQNENNTELGHKQAKRHISNEDIN